MKRAGEVAQVVECLPSMCEALSSNPTTTKKKDREIDSTFGWEMGNLWSFLQSPTQIFLQNS
jgi:hypothetical protein